MSKGFGKLERNIIEFFKENYSASTNDVIKYLRTKKNIKSHISSIYRAMKLLRKDGVLIPPKTRNLLKGSVPNSQLPNFYSLNKNSEKYKSYKKKVILLLNP